MTVDANGWLDWCIKLPATVNHVNPGTNPVKGIFFHSAEGFATTLLDPQSKWGYNGDLSWHLTNTLDGKLYQHYPFTARCWHATAANNEFVGMENEGRTPTDAQGNPIPPGPPLNAAQIANAKRVIADLSAWKGWTPERPFDVNDKTATLYQHGEVTRFGGTGSSCPNGRIPWDLILEDDMLQTERYEGELNSARALKALTHNLMLTMPIGFDPQDPHTLVFTDLQTKAEVGRVQLPVLPDYDQPS